MARKNPRFPYPRYLQAPFIFVPDGSPETPEVAQWKADHPGAVTFRATFIPRAPEPGQPPLRVFLTGGPAPLEFACSLDRPTPMPAPQWEEAQARWTEPEAEPQPPPEAEPPPLDARRAAIHRIVPPPGPQRRPVSPPGTKPAAEAAHAGTHPLAQGAHAAGERARLAYHEQLERERQRSRDAAPAAKAERAAQPGGAAPRPPPTIAEDVAATLRRWVAKAKAELGLSGGSAAGASARPAAQTHARHDAPSQAQSTSAALLGTGTARTGAGPRAPSGGKVAGAERAGVTSDHSIPAGVELRGKPQGTRGPNGDAHANASLRAAEKLVQDHPNVRTLHFHQSLRTATGHKSAPRELPDVTGIEAPDEHGVTGVHMREVQSPGQKPKDLRAKMDSMGKRLPPGFEVRSGKVIEHTYAAVPLASPQAEPAVEPPATTPPAADTPEAPVTKLPGVSDPEILDLL